MTSAQIYRALKLYEEKLDELLVKEYWKTKTTAYKQLQYLKAMIPRFPDVQEQLFIREIRNRTRIVFHDPVVASRFLPLEDSPGDVLNRVDRSLVDFGSGPIVGHRRPKQGLFR